MLFSTVAAPIYIPTTRAQGCPFLHTLTSPDTCLFNDSQSMLLKIKVWVTNKGYSKRKVGVHLYVKETPDTTRAKEYSGCLHQLAQFIWKGQTRQARAERDSSFRTSSSLHSNYTQQEVFPTWKDLYGNVFRSYFCFSDDYTGSFKKSNTGGGGAGETTVLEQQCAKK